MTSGRGNQIKHHETQGYIRLCIAVVKQAEGIIRQFGYDPINPTALGETENIEHWSWHDYMKRDIKLLCGCDYIYLLPNWSKSRGAKFEYMIADMLQIPCLNLQDIKETGGTK